MPSSGTYSVTILDADVTGQDFRNRARTYSISGVKFNDADGNGARDADEPGLSGWTINMVSPDANQVSVQTGEDGSYRFDNLAPGNYSLSEVLQDSWTQTVPASGTHSVDVVDTDVSGQDFGNRARTYSISGVKFNDLNGNGANEGEPGLEGWTINLAGPNGLQTTATTAVDGSYRFANLTPGTYTVSEVSQDQWVQTAPRSGLTCDHRGCRCICQDFGKPRKPLDIRSQVQRCYGPRLSADADEQGLSGGRSALANGSDQRQHTGSDGAYHIKQPGGWSVHH
jgi:hypothetical protein